ncbi:luc7-like protein 3 isoform X5 [Pleurodeles waltl]|uniref:luc7-like protein 3 isoform X5 n=1 Tax=Pleurodeles waltl TaxID=8319 RepID=UPI00370966F1
MMLSAAQLLDELMGRDRNLAPDEKRCNVRWDHESVCKYYLCEYCPAELFTNTRSDLGPCEKIHDENLRKQYEKSSRYMKMGYEREFLRYLQSLLAEVERRIRRGHARLALSQSQQAASQAAGHGGKNEEKVQVLTDKIDGLLQQIEELGSQGKVEEAQGMMKLVEQLKEEREMLTSTTSAKMRKRTEEPERDERLKKEREREERERDREEKERNKRREEEEKEKARHRERQKRSESRSRHSSKTSDRRSSRSRDHRRSRSRDRRRSRSRDSARSHDRAEKKHRSRSRDRRSKSRDHRSHKHRSKSRERDQERKSKERERRSSDEKRKRKSSTENFFCEIANCEPMECGTFNEVNGTREDIKSEGETQSN